MNELSERLAALDEALAKTAQAPVVPNITEIEKIILEFKNENTTRALVEALVANIIVDPNDKSYEINLGLLRFVVE